MPAKTKTAKTKTAKKKTPTKKKTTSTKKKSTTPKKKATAKKTVKKKTTAKKAAPKKKVAKKKPTAKKKTATKKKTTRKKSVKSSASPKIHLSEFVSPMTVIPFDTEDSFTPESIDLNDLPSMTDTFDIPMPTQEPKAIPVALPSRLSFYMGIFFGAIVLHALMISVLAIMSA